MPLRFIIPLLAGLLLQACISIPFGPSSDRGVVALEVVQAPKSAWAHDQVLLLPMDGLITMGDQRTGIDGDAGMLVEMKDRLDAARRNKKIKGVVVRINSPGGTVTASDLIHRELKRFKEETRMPIVAVMGDVAASGGLYVAMAADEIYALPTSITGSIGVMTMFPNFTGLADKIGIDMNVIKAGAMKDSGSPWRPMRPEERQLFQGLVDQFQQRFNQVIMESRGAKGMTKEQLARVGDGRVLTPEQAVAAKLIDGVKYTDEVFARAIELAGLRDAAVVSYEYPHHYRGNVYARSNVHAARAGGGGFAAPNVSLFSLGDREFLRGLAGAHFLYLWLP